MRDSSTTLSSSLVTSDVASVKRIAIYIRSVKTARGAEQVAALLAKGFADRAYVVDFLVEEAQGWLIDELESYSENINIVRIGNEGLKRRLEPIFSVYYALKVLLTFPVDRVVRGCTIRLASNALRKKFPLNSLISYVKSEKPMAVISLLNRPNIALLMARRLNKLETRLVVSVHNTISVSVDRSNSNWKRSVPVLMNCLFHFADRVVAVSQGVADDLVNEISLPSSQIEVVYNPVVRPELHSLAAQPVQHPWLEAKSCPVIVAASKLKPQKDLPMLFRAFRLVRQRRAIRLLLLGEGPVRDSLLHLAKELGIETDIDLLGFVKNPFAFFSRCDLFVMSSAWEGLPTALIEALACGCPVVSTDCPSGPAEILDGGRFGRLVPIGDHKAMASAIEETLDSPPPREALLQRAANFSVKDSVDHYEAIIRSP